MPNEGKLSSILGEVIAVPAGAGRLVSIFGEAHATVPETARLTAVFGEAHVTVALQGRLTGFFAEVFVAFGSNLYGIWPQERLANPSIQGVGLKTRLGQM